MTRSERPLLTTAQAAHRLGVKHQTLYAYVSRGLLHSHRSPDGRHSRFDPEEVEALARRGRPRAETRPTSLSLDIATAITCIEQHRVSYRGLDAADLARRASFEQVAELIWTGTLPERVPPWPGTAVPVADGPMADRLLSVCAHPAVHGPRSADPATVVDQGRRLIASVVASLPARSAVACPRLHLPAGGPPLADTVAGRLWTRLTSRRPTTGGVACLNAALVLLADHEMAASTVAARVAASTRADACAVVTAGLGALAGSLHGGASVQVRALLARAAAVGVPAAVDEAVERTGRLPGFGHAVYRDADPRCVALLELLDRHVPDRHRRLTDALLAEADRRVDAPVNVDLALGVLGEAFGMEPDAGEAVFATARMSGWLAHALEEYGERPLRFRARAVYIGEPPG